MEQANFGNVNPMYYQIMQVIMEEFKHERPGTAIPSESELVNRFGVSRGTVQRAIIELSRLGFLYRVQGKGTFVANTRIKREGFSLLSFTDEIKNHGYSTSAQILRFDVIVPEPDVMNALELDKNDTVYVIERIRFIEDDPMALVLSHVPQKLVPNLTLDDIQYSVYSALKRAGCEPVKAKDTFRAIMVDEEMALLLNCGDNLAAFASQRIAYTANNVPVEYVEGVIKGHEYALTIEPRSSTEDSRAYFHHAEKLD